MSTKLLSNVQTEKRPCLHSLYNNDYMKIRFSKTFLKLIKTIILVGVNCMLKKTTNKAFQYCSRIFSSMFAIDWYGSTLAQLIMTKAVLLLLTRGSVS